MSTPLRSETVTQPQPQEQQFKHFGVMNTGGQSKSSLFTSVTLNIVLAIVAIIIGAAAKKTIALRAKENLTYVAPVPVPEPKPIVKIIPPPPPPKLPPVKTIEPKILKPEVKLPDVPKPLEMKPVEKPLPAVAPAPPKVVVAAAAPKPVAVNLARSASVANNDPHPAAVSLGTANNPLHSDRPAVAAVDLGSRGLAGMPARTTGGGPPASSVNLGSGQPGGAMNGTGSRGVQGVKFGVTNGTPGGTGNGVGNRPAVVALGHAPETPQTQQARAEHPPVRTGPQVLFKPRPVYTAEATSMHLEGTVSVRIRVSSNAAVSVIGVTNGLGHGLDESAVHAIQATRFKPAVDASGNPVDWEGVVNISFQLAS
ncbi:energy transducer TonB [Granulicella tundricola]|uniref:TonB family protein n=1 Tax=Granulicella tundricola (strain ATCC BAA-1859 / DSM 23138 / MP5ACTX9) TaxID=1198114 RepID=E8WXS7_GRATM|nr:energy transducer TonB [Granulicella tundricola]ADW69772.1 TonB family protein [Granulicella tundricola MP5ACTX9]